METPRKLARQKPPKGYAWIDDYVNEAGEVEVPGIASRCGVTVSTFRKWRMAGKGPQAFPLGKKVAARIEAINAWLAEQERQATDPTAESRPAEARLIPAA